MQMIHRAALGLALLLAAASGVQARGARFKGSGGSHGSSHSTPHAESSDGGVHLPSVRPRSQGGSEQNQAAAGGATSSSPRIISPASAR